MPFSTKLPLTLGCTVKLSRKSLDKLHSTFQTVYHRLDGSFPSSELEQIEMLFSTGRGIPPTVESIDRMPKLKLVQLSSAGADSALKGKAMSAYAKAKADRQQNRDVTLASASGTHVISIPNYAVAMVISLLHQLPRQIITARNEKRWLSEEEADFDGEVYYARSTYGRTAGLLGYGSLGRETARLLKAHGMGIIAANTSGKATPQDGYVIPGTGDQDGSIPEAYFSTNNPESIKQFLQQTDVLVASLPGTEATKYFLTKERLALLPDNAVLVNVGRGTLVRSDDLLDALSTPNRLYGAAIDVTDPEPLPTGHPLYAHPRCVVTPHVSGNAEGEMDIAADIALANARKLVDGEKLYNVVDITKGY